MERSGMLKPDLLRNSPRLSTQLRNQFELTHNTPQLLKHGVGCWAFLSTVFI